MMSVLEIVVILNFHTLVTRIGLDVRMEVRELGDPTITSLEERCCLQAAVGPAGVGMA